MSFFAVPGIISGLGASWSPLDLSPEFWMRADLGHAYADSDPVAAIANQGTAGSSGDLQQGTGANQPVYDASHASFNGQAVITFDGGDVLYAAAGTWWHLASESASMAAIAVVRTTLGATTAQTAVRTRTYTSVGGFGLIYREGAACRFDSDESGGVASIADTGGNGTINTLAVLAGVLTGAVTTASDTGEVWLDGTSGGGSGADFAAAVAASSNREFLLGGTATTTGDFTGSIAEVIFLKRVLTSGEDASLTAYLNARYGLSLPGVTQ